MAEDEENSGVVTLTESEWQEEGLRLFGENTGDWKFVCPSCGNVQSMRDLERYKDRGAVPSDTYQRCIGYFMPKEERSGDSLCDYASFGFMKLSKTNVKGEDGSINSVFDFYTG